MESSPDLFNSMGSRLGVTRGGVESSKDPGRPQALRSGVCGVSRSHEMASKKLLRVLVPLKIRAIAKTITTLNFGGGGVRFANEPCCFPINGVTAPFHFTGRILDVHCFWDLYDILTPSKQLQVHADMRMHDCMLILFRP